MKILEAWKEFSTEWKRVRTDFSEPAVHDLRVAARRLISELELAASITRTGEAATVVLQVQRILKHLGPLRDIQVHRRHVETLGHSDFLTRFAEFLKQRERDEVRGLRTRLRERKRKSLHRDVRDVAGNLQKVLPGMSRRAIRSAIQAVVKERLDALIASEASYRKSGSPEKFHRMRIQFKTYRYASEAAQPVMRSVTPKKLAAMKEVQGLMGEIHDLENLRLELAAWSGDSGNSVSASLDKKYKKLLKSFNDRADFRVSSISRRERVAPIS